MVQKFPSGRQANDLQGTFKIYAKAYSEKNSITRWLNVNLHLGKKKCLAKSK